MKEKFSPKNNADALITLDGVIKLPHEVYLLPNGKFVDTMGIGDEGYAEAVMYQLQITVTKDVTVIDYYGEDDSLLSNVCPDWFSDFENINN